ncbi:phage tail protein [Sodalis endosymbiont of Spalangia cameroni]|uniref:phage tail-collar fiber domain-containing protein n=1 Tax=Sodalis praecaptivus TaxID=1239307 RepID=UPI0031F9CB63
MSIKFFGILTHQGAARLANAAALGVKIKLSAMAVGDGGGSLPFPDPTQTALKGERRRAALNHLSIDPLNGNQIIAEQVIPENEGGWWIREMGLFDKDGTLIAVANCPESYKPQMQEGSGRTQTIRMVLIVNSTKELALKIDPSIVLATRKYVDDGVIEVKAYADTLMATHAHHADPHPQYAPKASPVFTGELHSGGGATFGGNIHVSWGGRSAIFHENGDVTGPMWGGPLSSWLHNQLRQGVPPGIPLPWPQQEAPSGWLKCNGAAFDKTLYPLLAQAYPSGALPDLRGEFIRGWDDGRGVDSGRVLQSEQGDTIRNITGSLFYGYDADIKAPTTNASTGATYYDTSEKLRDTENGLTVSVNYNYNAWYPAKLDASRVVPTSNEARPRNVAFNYIVRAT